jgi:hypothetical protein
MSITDGSVTEGNSKYEERDAHDVAVSVFGGTVTVSYETVDGTATAPSSRPARHRSRSPSRSTAT